MINKIEKYILDNWKSFNLGEKPDKLYFIKHADRGIRDKRVGTITFKVVGKIGTKEKDCLLIRIPRYPNNNESAATLEFEFNNLLYLNKVGLSQALASTIPNAILLETISGSRVLGIGLLQGESMGEKILTEDLFKPFQRNSELAFDWLVNFEQELGAQKHNDFQSLTESTISRYKSLSKNNNHDKYFGQLVERSKTLHSSNIPIFPQHVDFHAGNIFISNDKISGVIDWEDFSTDGLPFFDFFHFIKTYVETIYYYLADLNNPALIDRFAENEVFLSMIEEQFLKYCNKIGIDKDLIKVMLPLYIIESANICMNPRKKADANLWIFENLFNLDISSLKKMQLALGVFAYKNLQQAAIARNDNETAKYCTEKINSIFSSLNIGKWQST